MGVVEATLGALALLTVGLSGYSQRKDFDDLIVATVLLLGWCFSASLREAARVGLWTADEILLANPVMDLLTGVLVVAFHRARPAHWKRVLIVLLMAQIGAHAAFALSDKALAARYSYTLGLNLSFIAQLACAGSKGAGDFVAAALDRLRGSSVPHRPRLGRRGR